MFCCVLISIPYIIYFYLKEIFMYDDSMLAICANYDSMPEMKIPGICLRLLYSVGNYFPLF